MFYLLINSQKTDKSKNNYLFFFLEIKKVKKYCFSMLYKGKNHLRTVSVWTKVLLLPYLHIRTWAKLTILKQLGSLYSYG